MSEEAKTAEQEPKKLEVVEDATESEEAPKTLSADEQKALVAQKMKELQDAGVRLPMQVPPAMGMPQMGASPMMPMGPGMQAPMTSIGAPPMVGAPQPPMPHHPDPMQMPPEMQQERSQHKHPAVKHIREERDIKMTSDGLVQLDPMMMLEIELLSAELRAATAEEQLAGRSLRDARERLMSLNRKQSLLMSTITSQLGIPAGRSIRLVDKEQRLCRIED